MSNSNDSENPQPNSQSNNQLNNHPEQVEGKDVFQMMYDGDATDLSAPYFTPAREEMMRSRTLCRKANNTSPDDPTYVKYLEELLGTDLSDKRILTPFQLDFGNQVKLGKGVFINHSFIGSASGGIVIEDNVQIAPNVTILSINHDPYARNMALCKRVTIKKNAWIGARVTILPGVTIGESSIIGAGAVVTKDIPDNSIAVGNPACVIRTLDHAPEAMGSGNENA